MRPPRSVSRQLSLQRTPLQRSSLLARPAAASSPVLAAGTSHRPSPVSLTPAQRHDSLSQRSALPYRQLCRRCLVRSARAEISAGLRSSPRSLSLSLSPSGSLPRSLRPSARPFVPLLSPPRSALWVAGTLLARSVAPCHPRNSYPPSLQRTRARRQRHRPRTSYHSLLVHVHPVARYM